MSESSYSEDHTGWFVGVIVTLALLAIGYLVFTANAPRERMVLVFAWSNGNPVVIPEPYADEAACVMAMRRINPKETWFKCVPVKG